jgi:hypothetical protein
MSPRPSAEPLAWRSSWREWLAIGCAFANLLYAAYRLPAAAVLLRRSETPLDHSRIHASATEYRLLVKAAQLIPAGATVVVRSATGDAEREFYLHRFGVSLLPGRRVLPAIAVGPVDQPGETVEYAVVVGRAPDQSQGELLSADDDGSIWRVRHP